MADESDRFCTQCGPLGMEDDADGRAVSPIDEDGSCRFCGCDTCGLDQLREHLAARGLHVVTTADKTVLDGCTDLETSTCVAYQRSTPFRFIAQLELARRETKR
jgi:hypothetical protein